MKNETIIAVMEGNGYTLTKGYNDNYDFELREYLDGTFLSRHRGFGEADIWTEWEENIIP